MASDRSDDIRKVKRDLRRLDEADGIITEMTNSDNKINNELLSLAEKYEYSVIIPQQDFKYKMTALHENVSPSLSSVSKKISDLRSELENLLSELEEEQRKWEDEQKNKSSESSGT